MKKAFPYHAAAAAVAVGIVAGLAPVAPSGAFGGTMQLRDGYFWDPGESRPFVPRGIAYQTWNPPVFANQSFDQIDYDLREFKRMRANSVRVEFVWNQVEVADGVFDWSKPDYLVAKAEELGLKLFVIIGFQYPPIWFPGEWHAINDRGTKSDVLNYEHPSAQAAYTDYIRTVAARYRDSESIAAWILGNEFAYFDLWEPPDQFPARRMLGYDPISLESFRGFLSDRYSGSVSALNANWGRNFASFAEVAMPARYPDDRNDPGYHDLIAWRQQSIGNFIAMGAAAARQADPNHLLTYSMVGGIFNGNDANNTCEDGETIVARCAAAGAPLDFWSINNYAWATEGSELRSGDYGISKYQELLGLPVMLSETGHSSTEDILPGASARQADAVPGQLWEAMLSGAVGVHLFHWSDRDQFLGGFFAREAGFGIVSQKRLPKHPVYANTEAMLARMAEIDVDRLLAGSSSPPADIRFFWSDASEMGWPRANQENAMVWGALKRLGYQPGLLNDSQFDAGDFRGARALVLSRAYQLEPDDLERLETDVIGSGIHVHANADLPGQFDTYHRPNPGWASRMASLFGLDVTTAAPVWDAGVVGGFLETYRELELVGATPLGSIGGNYSKRLLTWKIWEGVKAISGTTILRQRSALISGPSGPSLQLMDHGSARSAANLFAIGDVFATASESEPPADLWNTRSDVLGAIYRDHFGIVPAIELSGPGAAYVVPDYRICRNGTHLISLLNEHTSPASVRLHSPDLLGGRTVEDLTNGAMIIPNPDGTIELALHGDEYLLLYAYVEDGPFTRSLVNPGLPKLWIEAAPTTVRPNPEDEAEITVRYDTRGQELSLSVALELAPPGGTARRMSQSPSILVAGVGVATLRVPVPDADLGDPEFLSTHDGGIHSLRAVLADRGAPVSSSNLPVQLALGPRPEALPVSVQPGQVLEIPVVWDDLPSYEPADVGTPLDRAVLWDSAVATRSHYNIILTLFDRGTPIAAESIVTRDGSGRHSFVIRVPDDASGPFTWTTEAQAAPGASTDVVESLEGRETGANIIWPPPDDPPPPRDVDLIDPWKIYTYSHQGDPGRLYQNHGVHQVGSHGSQSMFLVMANPADVGDFSGFGVSYRFTEPRELPSTPEALGDYHFSCDFMEATARPCVLELQLKDEAGATMVVNRAYEPGPEGWDSLGASLAEFSLAPWSTPGEFDWSRVSEIVINAAMLEHGPAVQYVASIDNIVFDAPELFVDGGPVITAYQSGNDSPVDTDGDGIPDAFETGGGVFRSETDTGTAPGDPDSDDDGQSDGDEIAAGTDPNSADDWFRIDRIERAPDGTVTLFFGARTGRVYGVEMWSRESADTAGAFRLIPGFAELVVENDGPAAVDLMVPPAAKNPILRLRVHRAAAPQE